MPLKGSFKSHDAATAVFCILPVWLCLFIGGMMFGGANVAYQFDEAAKEDWARGACTIHRNESRVLTLDCGRGNRVHQAQVSVELAMRGNATRRGTALKRPSWRKDCGGEDENCGHKFCFKTRAKAKHFLKKFDDGRTYPCWRAPAPPVPRGEADRRLRVSPRAGTTRGRLTTSRCGTTGRRSRRTGSPASCCSVSVGSSFSSRPFSSSTRRRKSPAPRRLRDPNRPRRARASSRAPTRDKVRDRPTSAARRGTTCTSITRRFPPRAAVPPAKKRRGDAS